MNPMDIDLEFPPPLPLIRHRANAWEFLDPGIVDQPPIPQLIRQNADIPNIRLQ